MHGAHEVRKEEGANFMLSQSWSFRVLYPAWATRWLCDFQVLPSPVCFLISTMGALTGKVKGPQKVPLVRGPSSGP